jgi:hypothetical protein
MDSERKLDPKALKIAEACRFGQVHGDASTERIIRAYLAALPGPTDEAVEALRYYANPDNWRDTPSWDGDPSCITPKAIPVTTDPDDGSEQCDCGDIARAALAHTGGDGVEVHSDDLAVDRFATAMKAKLKWEREERGRHGWDDPTVCSDVYLAKLLIEHLVKGNPGTFEDVANFAMMLHQRKADPMVLRSAISPQGRKT